MSVKFTRYLHEYQTNDMYINQVLWGVPNSNRFASGNKSTLERLHRRGDGTMTVINVTIV